MYILEPQYPVGDIYATIQADGNTRGGEPVILVRFVVPEGWKYAYLDNMRPIDNPTIYTASELLDKIAQVTDLYGGNTYDWAVHLTGNDPCTVDVPYLVQELKALRYRISIGTCGGFLLPTETIVSISEIYIYVRPGIPLHEDMLKSACELRFVVGSSIPELNSFAEDFIGAIDSRAAKDQSQVPHFRRIKDKILVLPHTNARQDIDYAIEFCLGHKVRFHIPLYKALPEFDESFQTNIQASRAVTSKFNPPEEKVNGLDSVLVRSSTEAH